MQGAGLGWSLVDLAIVTALALAVLIGIRLGAVRGASGIAWAGLLVVLLLVAYAPLARSLRRITGLGEVAAIVLAFAILGLAGQLIGVCVIQRPLAPVLDRVGRSRWLRRLDAGLGAVPGAALGLLIVGLLLPFLAVALPGTGLSAAVRGSRLAPRLLHAEAMALHRLRVSALLQPAARALAPTQPLTTSDRGRQLPFRVPPDDLLSDPTAEEQLLALVNAERTQRGLSPLTADSALVPIAHAHAVEMFDLGYFAHESPNTGTPFDRLLDGGIASLAAGENLAYAPSVEIAHRGLMESPGHRANILSPAFGRAGIGIVRSRYYGLMIVQLFRD